MKTLAMGVAALSLSACALCGERNQLPQLGDHNWLVSQLDSQAVIEGSTLSLQFAEDGRVSGKAGCNGFSGTYTQNAHNLSISQLARTKRLCRPAELMRQEQAFLDSLAMVSSFSIEDGRLKLQGQGGSVILAELMQP